jgi:putative inorganic carbon (hco3(-)) transporter
MESISAVFSGPSFRLRELPWAGAFAAGLSALVIGTAFLPACFAAAAAGGLFVLSLACFVENKRLYWLCLVALSLVFQTSKRLIIVDDPGLGRTDSVSVNLPDLFVLAGLAGLLMARALEPAGAARASAGTDRDLRWPMAAVFLAALLSVVKSERPELGVCELVRMGKCALLYAFIAYGVRSLREVRWVLGCLAVGLFFELGVGLLQKIAVEGVLGLEILGEAPAAVQSWAGDEAFRRVGGTFGHPNYFAYYLDLLAPLMLALSFSGALSRRGRTLYTLALGAALVCLFLTRSRGGWLATGIALLLCGAVIARRNLRCRVFGVRTFAFALAGLAGLAAVSGPMAKRLTERDAGAWSARLAQYRVAGRMIQDHPLLGVGLNKYVPAAQSYDDTASRISTRFKMPVHNVYLLAWAETGAVGLLALAFLVVSALRMAYFGRWPYGETYDLHLGLFFGLAAYFVHANVDMNPIPSYAVCFFILGLLTAVHRIARRDLAEESRS